MCCTALFVGLVCSLTLTNCCRSVSPIYWVYRSPEFSRNITKLLETTSTDSKIAFRKAKVGNYFSLNDRIDKFYSCIVYKYIFQVTWIINILEKQSDNCLSELKNT